jgi:murein DD-endopeptidase MepM/ murein hydrolase activator NlpD
MIIKRAVNPTYLIQGFDALPQMVQFYKDCGMSAHGGYDYPCVVGTPILWNSDIPGVVIYNEEDGAGGLGCSVLCKFGDRVFKFRFWHLSKFGCQKGEVLKKGMLIGWSGNTGKSTGPHLHFDVKELIPNPEGKYQGLNDRYDQKYPDNGTFGTVRMDEWMKDIYVLDGESLDVRLRSALVQIIKNIIYK